jgi:hypothetical protein
MALSIFSLLAKIPEQGKCQPAETEKISVLK